MSCRRLVAEVHLLFAIKPSRGLGFIACKLGARLDMGLTVVMGDYSLFFLHCCLFPCQAVQLIARIVKAGGYKAKPAVSCRSCFLVVMAKHCVMTNCL